MAYVVRFNEPGAEDPTVVGGKGANLGRLTRAGFPVPAGFTVTTEAYRQFTADNGLAEKIRAAIGTINFDDVADVEARTAEIREWIHEGELPAKIAAEIAAYEQLGDNLRVAVRSSGTAEDLEAASFAGQHDTYLHIRGLDGVKGAVKRCWASLWTARATAYRRHKGFDQGDIGIAVVVQTMIEAEVSGVMFTANPITADTTEIGINASYGLGEAVVSGAVTPDAYSLNVNTLRVKNKTLGTKAIRIVLDHAAGHGTITEDVPGSDQARFSLTDAQASALGELGRRVMHYYDGFPQDTEWALADGVFYLLQARPVTGAEFSWDEAIDNWHTVPEDDDTVWSKTLSDEAWTGAVTPMYYSIVGSAFARCNVFANNLWGFEDTAKLRYQKYHRGVVYWNSQADKNFVARVAPPQLRPTMLANICPVDHDEVLKAPYSYLTLPRILARIQALAPTQGPLRWLKVQKDYIDNRREEAKGLNDEQLRLLSDESLITYCEDRIGYKAKYIEDLYVGYFLHSTLAIHLFTHLLTSWYDGANPNVMGELLTGTIEQTFTVTENLAVWDLAQDVRSSEKLRTLFEAHPGRDFFLRLDDLEEGRAFRKKYESFLQTYGHRGHADRDVYFVRRAEDPEVDYRLISVFLNVDEGHDPSAIEEAACRRKQAAVEDVSANLRAKPFGSIRAEIFGSLNSYIQKMLVDRDNERGFVDICTYTIKRTLLEINRRLMERRVLTGDLDFYFLGRQELYDVFRGHRAPLTQAKIAGRKRNFDRMNAKEVGFPTFMQHNQSVEDESFDDVDGKLKGLPTSGGIVTGIARRVSDLSQIGRLRQGDIMVCNSTDPGWTPVFLLLSGAVFETGGAFAHCSCLSREYGIPAVQLPGALHRIPDGATITVDGYAGVVILVDTQELAPAAG